MKFGVRKPSLNKRIAARTSLKRYVRHSLGVKAPRGMGWITNPKKAAYNRVYNRTTISADKLLSGKGGEALLFLIVFGLVIIAFQVVFFIIKEIVNLLSNNKNQTAPPLSANPESRFTLATDSSTPCCPRCSRPMVKRIAKRGRSVGNEFWGCHNFPSCRGTRTIPY